MTLLWGNRQHVEGVLAQRRETIRNPEQENDPDDATVGCSGPGDGMVQARMVAGGGEGAAHRCGHQGIHGYQAKREGRQTHQAPGCSAQVGGEEKQRQLARRLSSHTVQDANDEHGLSVIHPLETLGLGKVPVKTSPHSPCHPQHSIDGDGQAAFDAAVTMAVRVFSQNSSYYANAENDQSKPDQPFSPVIQPLGETQMQLQDGRPQRGHSKSMAQGICHTQAQAAAPVALYRGDVGDGGQVIVIEAVAQSQQEARAERGVEFPVAKDWCHRAKYIA